MNTELVKKVLLARSRSVPLVAITSADQWATCESLKTACNGSVPVIRHDIVSGLVAMNEVGRDALQAALQYKGLEQRDTQAPVDMLVLLTDILAGSMIICLNANRWLQDASSSQAVSNLRDVFKSDQRMLVLLGADMQLPLELRQDVVLFDEALPSREELRESVIRPLCESSELQVSDDKLRDSAEALSGMSSFCAEQRLAMALSKSGIDIDICWEGKRKQVEQTKGLKMALPKVTYKDVGGLSNAKADFAATCNGPLAPRLIVRMEEIEKLMAGSVAGGDNTGVSQDFLQVLLNEIENNGWIGSLFLGPGGSGKSYFSEAVAGEFGLRCINLDTGAMKTSALGESEAAIRAAFRTIRAIGEDRVMILATCNGLQELRPELQRRLSSCLMWYFDLPDEQEKAAIWNIQISKWGLGHPLSLPNDSGWSSSDIRDCCRRAYMQSIPLIVAAQNIISATSREGERIESLRRMAAGRLVSASYTGAYRMPVQSMPAAAGRKLSLGGDL